MAEPPTCLTGYLYFKLYYCRELLPEGEGSGGGEREEERRRESHTCIRDQRGLHAAIRVFLCFEAVSNCLHACGVLDIRQAWQGGEHNLRLCSQKEGSLEETR